MDDQGVSATMIDQEIALHNCHFCDKDFAVLYCPKCWKSGNPCKLCESCDKRIHKAKGRREHRRVQILFKQMAQIILTDANAINVTSRTILVVTGLVLLFFAYPSMMSEIIVLAQCKSFYEYTFTVNETTSYRFDTRNYLTRDVTIDCNTSEHGSFRILSLLVYVFYGVAIPVLGFVFLRRNQEKLSTRRFLAKFGFLYSGYTLKYYYWEMILLFRKAWLIFIIAVNPDVDMQVYVTMWSLTVFLILNVRLHPLKYFHKLESLALGSQVITLNMFLLLKPTNEDDNGIDHVHLPSNRVTQTIATIIILGANVSVLLLFIYTIYKQLLQEIAFLAKGDPFARIPRDVLSRTWEWVKLNLIEDEEEESEDVTATGLTVSSTMSKKRQSMDGAPPTVPTLWEYLRKTDPESQMVNINLEILMSDDPDTLTAYRKRQDVQGTMVGGRPPVGNVLEECLVEPSTTETDEQASPTGTFVKRNFDQQQHRFRFFCVECCEVSFADDWRTSVCEDCKARKRAKQEEAERLRTRTKSSEKTWQDLSTEMKLSRPRELLRDDDKPVWSKKIPVPSTARVPMVPTYLPKPSVTPITAVAPSLTYNERMAAHKRRLDKL
eukprot:PhF_6_TR10608/c0_g1_i2/m.17105